MKRHGGDIVRNGVLKLSLYLLGGWGGVQTQVPTTAVRLLETSRFSVCREKRMRVIQDRRR